MTKKTYTQKLLPKGVFLKTEEMQVSKIKCNLRYKISLTAFILPGCSASCSASKSQLISVSLTGYLKQTLSG